MQNQPLKCESLQNQGAKCAISRIVCRILPNSAKPVRSFTADFARPFSFFPQLTSPSHNSAFFLTFLHYPFKLSNALSIHFLLFLILYELSTFHTLFLISFKTPTTMQERSCVLSFSTFFAKYFCSDFRFSKFLQVHFLLFCSQVFSRTYFSPYTGLYASAVSYVPSFMGLHVFQNVLECYFVLVFSEFLQNILFRLFDFLNSSKFTFYFSVLKCSQEHLF